MTPPIGSYESIVQQEGPVQPFPISSDLYSRVRLNLTKEHGLKTVQIISSLDVKNGGPFYSIPRLCSELAKLDADVHLIAVEHPAPTVGGVSQPRYPATIVPLASALPLLSRLRYSQQLKPTLERAAASADLVHTHGVWELPNIIASNVAKQRRLPLVVSPLGMLARAPTRTRVFPKLLMWHLLQRTALRKADCFLASSTVEAEELYQLNLGRPIAVIPRGSDLPQYPQAEPRQEWQRRDLLFLGRLAPIKNLDALIRAWSLVERRSQHWMLRIVGPDDRGHVKTLKRLAQELQLTRVAFEGPLWGEAKETVLREADALVLPSVFESFGVAAAEALAASTPVIVGEASPWRHVQEEGCGWSSGLDPESLATTIIAALSLPRSELLEMGRKGRKMVEESNSWPNVAKMTLELYRWVAGTGRRPGFIF